MHNLAPAPLLDPLPRFEAWLARRRRLVGATIVLFAVAVRLVYFLQLSSGPCLVQHHWNQTDMAFFDQWAQTITAGDVLVDRPLFPTHDWHEEVARAFCRDYPERVPALQARVGEDGIPSLTHAIWSHWLGGKTFYQDPLYPYCVAVTYRVAGSPEVRGVFAWQLALGVASTLLAYLLTRALFGELAGLAAGLLTVLSSTFLYYEMLLLREACLVFATLALLALTAVVERKQKVVWFFLAGLGFGVAIVLKSSLGLYCLAAAPVLVLAGRPGARVALLRTVALAAGGTLALVPAIGRNVAVGVPPLTLASSGPLTFANCNAADNPNQGGFYASGRLHVILEDSGGTWLPVIRETLKTHASIGSYLDGLEKRFFSLWHWYEVPDDSNFYYYRLQAPILFLPVTFAVLGPLGIVGVVLWCVGVRGSANAFAPNPEASAPGPGTQYGVTARLAVVMVLIAVVTPLLFGSSSRLRLPLQAALIPFAGLAVSSVTAWVVRRQLLPAGLAVTVFLLVAVGVSRPLPPGEHRIRLADYTAAHEYYQGRLQEARRRGDFQSVAELLEQYLATEPPELLPLSASSPPRDKYEEVLAGHFALVHSWYAEALRALRRNGEAADQRQAAQRLLNARSAGMGK